MAFSCCVSGFLIFCPNFVLYKGQLATKDAAGGGGNVHKFNFPRALLCFLTFYVPQLYQLSEIQTKLWILSNTFFFTSSYIILNTFCISFSIWVIAHVFLCQKDSIIEKQREKVQKSVLPTWNLTLCISCSF